VTMQILVVDDDQAVRQMVGAVLREDGFEVLEAADGQAALELGRRNRFDLVFCDVKMGRVSGFDVLRAFREELQPDADIILMTGYASIESALDAVRYGARDYICKPFSIEDLSGVARSALERRQTVKRAETEAAASAEPEFADFVAKSAAMANLLKTITRTAVTDLPTLVFGESGTGKNAVARAIHAHSGRAGRPLLTVDCGALTDTLLEADLFGHVPDAFPGAAAGRQGLFELADGGTLLLDEVTELSLGTQEKLLRVLHDGAVLPLGAQEPIKVDVRVVATTNRDPEALVAARQLRHDLLYRLNVVSIRVPPLRERSGDIDPMIHAFLSRFRPRGMGTVRFAPEALERLRAYAWPGNVRELRHVVQRLAASSPGLVKLSDLPEHIRNAHGDLDELLHELPSQDVVGPAWSGAAAGENGGDPAWQPLTEIERRYLVRVLYHTRGNKKRAAEVLGVDRKTLSRMVERHSINVARIKRDVRGLK
jgi:two-component system, NtrC family, response regulator AtoC